MQKTVIAPSPIIPIPMPELLGDVLPKVGEIDENGIETAALQVMPNKKESINLNMDFTPRPKIGEVD